MAKVRSELELRKNYLLAQPTSASSSAIPENSVSNAMKSQLQDVDELLLRLMKSQNFKPNEGKIVKGSRGCEQEVYDWAWFDREDLFGSELLSDLITQDQKYQVRKVSAPLPQMIETRKLLPAFRAVMKGRIPTCLK